MMRHDPLPLIVPFAFLCASSLVAAQGIGDFESRREEIRRRVLAADRAGDLAAKRAAVRDLEALELELAERESAPVSVEVPAARRSVPAFRSSPSSPGLGAGAAVRRDGPARAPLSAHAALLAAAGSQGPVLRRGAVGDQVEALQGRLAELGYDPGPVDGVFGAATEKALRAFQADAGLDVDGVVGPATRKALATETDEGPLAEAIAGGDALARGDRGDAVRELQARLAAAGYPVEATGVYDEATEAAVRAFQADHATQPNGRFGKTTMGELKKVERGEDPALLERVVRAGGPLGLGSEGPAVRELQEKLTELGYPVAATGRIGPTTEEKIRAFQRDHGVAETGKVGPTTLDAIRRAESSAGSARQRRALLDAAIAHARGRRPRGRCYEWVSIYIDQAGYGGIPKGGFGRSIPSTHWGYARDFADYLNQGDNAARLGLRRLPLDNPYDAPEGAIVVVAPGSPGTRHPTAGDITVADGKGGFYNDGEMGYGGRSAWPPRRGGVLGIYVPAK